MDDDDLLASLQDLSLQEAYSEDLDLKNAVNSLFQQLNTTQTKFGKSQPVSTKPAGYDKTKLLVALLGNFDLVTCAIKKLNQLVSLGKRMEEIYRSYYVDPNIELDLDEIGQLIESFTDIYNSESYVREVNVTRVYQAYCKKLIDIHNTRRTFINSDEAMIS